MRFVFLLIAVLFLSAPAWAADGIVHCGIPDDVDVETNPGFEFCDVYSRQLAYKPKRDKLRSQLEERQKNFIAPSLAAYKNYKQELEALHDRGAAAAAEAKGAEMDDEITEESDESTAFGPPNPDDYSDLE